MSHNLFSREHSVTISFQECVMSHNHFPGVFHIPFSGVHSFTISFLECMMSHNLFCSA